MAQIPDSIIELTKNALSESIGLLATSIDKIRTYDELHDVCLDLAGMKGTLSAHLDTLSIFVTNTPKTEPQ